MLDYMRRMTAEVGDHPWAVRKHQRSKSTDLTESELKRLRHESASAKKSKIPWEERGPTQDYTSMMGSAAGSSSGAAASSSGGASSSSAAASAWEPSVPYWRGQPFRTGAYGGKMRFAKRGGQNKEYYARLNRAGLLKPTAKGAVRVTKPEDKPW